ncbi:zinc-dependent alcohol dehydrogenase family protein [Helicobacter suis]|uniref:zinc-dependent alcohol dehydrogenase family protein n=1 Tax=Helicobacter suis TaxID=104628 RepID=UPI0013D83B06|nr:zinc-dependent alcohol dehydrogenase family protein [Helicobacter suis]
MSKQVQFNKTGNSDVLEIVKINIPAPQADEVQITFSAWGLNRAEIMHRRGQYVIEPQFPAKLGYEGTGVVRAVGEHVSHVKVGDKVSVISDFLLTNTYIEVANLPANAVIEYFENLSFEQAAASWMAFVKAYKTLIELANLQAGEYVVLRVASSSVSLATIQIAKMQGATVIALSHTHAEGDILLTKGADFVLTTQDDITVRLLEITKGQGVDMVFDPFCGEDAYAIFRAMALNGRYFIYAALSHEDMSVPTSEILSKNLTLRGYGLSRITADAGSLKRAKAYICEGLASGRLHPEIDRVFPFAEIRQAYDYTIKNSVQIGRVVITL